MTRPTERAVTLDGHFVSTISLASLGNAITAVKLVVEGGQPLERKALAFEKGSKFSYW